MPVTRSHCNFFKWAIILGFFAFAATPGMAAERTMIVLDGSGSMWGQIDGVPKLTIARETLREVLPQVPGETELGLMSYGHREKGNCDDIEIIVAPAPGSSQRIADEADNLNFLGKTPLTAAVRMAAESMRYTEDAATVILITDGIETCEADPCALGHLLESQGVNFTAHVVGFGLSEEEGRQVACLAENTGGIYVSAEDADGLVEALNEVVVAPVPAAVLAAEVSFVARDQDGVDFTDFALNWTILDADGKTVHETTQVSPERALDAGAYSVLVSAEGVSGGTEFSIDTDLADQTVIVPVEVIDLSATLDGPETAAIGSAFEVTWTGPDHQLDYITVVATGADEGTFGSYAYTKNANPAELTAPDGVGTFELRYVHGPSDRTLASAPIEITAVAASLEAPERVAAGAEFEVNWKGPDNQRDFITIVEVGADEGAYGSYAYTNNANPAVLTAPDGLGTYELRYVLDASDRTLVSVPIEVTAVTATLAAPASVGVGGQFEVEWTGPDNARDFVTIVPAGADEGSYESYAYTRNASPAELTAPGTPGAYEVRYVLDASDRTLARTPIEVTEVKASLEAPVSVGAGSQFEVSWTGPDNVRDFITIVAAGADEGSYESYAYTANANPAELTAPDATGAHEVRYVLDASDRTLASVPIEVTAAAAALQVSGKPVAGGTITVTWTGPDNDRDYVTIVAAGTADGAYGDYVYTRNGSPVELDIPETSGAYEIWYVMGNSKRTLARLPITVTAASGKSQ